MSYLIELKSETIYVTPVYIFWAGKPRKMAIESRPEYAVIRLSGTKETFPVPWDEVFQAAHKRHEVNIRREQQASVKSKRSRPGK